MTLLNKLASNTNIRTLINGISLATLLSGCTRNLGVTGEITSEPKQYETRELLGDVNMNYRILVRVSPHSVNPSLDPKYHDSSKAFETILVDIVETKIHPDLQLGDQVELSILEQYYTKTDEDCGKPLYRIYTRERAPAKAVLEHRTHKR